jgi:hypothetical protein
VALHGRGRNQMASTAVTGLATPRDARSRPLRGTGTRDNTDVERLVFALGSGTAVAGKVIAPSIRGWVMPGTDTDPFRVPRADSGPDPCRVP